MTDPPAVALRRLARRAAGAANAMLSRRARAACLATALAVWAQGAPAADGKVDGVAAMSLIGDSLSIVTFRPSIGSSIDQNVRDDLPLANDHFDRLALRTVGAAIARLHPGQSTALLLTSDPAVFRGAENAVVSRDGVEALLKPLAAQLDPETRYLVLVTKRRDAARLKFLDGRIGSGWLSGLGFYVDHVTRHQDVESGALGLGFVAPFAYLDVSLVDLRTGTVVRSAPITESAAAGSHSRNGGDAWEALTSDEKVRYLDQLIQRSLDEAVPKLFAGS